MFLRNSENIEEKNYQEYLRKKHIHDSDNLIEFRKRYEFKQESVINILLTLALHRP